MKTAREITINTMEGREREKIGAHLYIRGAGGETVDYLIPYTLLSRIIAEAETVMEEKLNEGER